MMAQATSDNPPFQAIMVYDISRFSRSVGDLKRWTAGTGGERRAGNLQRGTYRQHPSVGDETTDHTLQHVGPASAGPFPFQGNLYGLTAPTMAQTPTAPSPRESQ